MAYLALFVVLLAFLAVAWLGASWAIQRERRPFSDHDQPTAPLPATLHALGVPSDAQLEEMGLVEDLFAGSLSPEQYRHRMAALAMRDAHRHPMSVPSDGNE